MIKEIIPVKYAESFLQESMVYKNGAEDKFFPIVFMVYLIKTEDRLVLIDAGCETIEGFDMKDFIGPVKALAKLNVSPEDIDDVVITHSHHDHIECVREFKNANIYIQKDEYACGKGYFRDGMKVILFDDETEVCPGIKVIKIGGHSCGSCVVEILKDEKKYVIVGDECYSRKCIEEKIPSGMPYNPQKNLEFLEKYSTDEYFALLCHDE